MTEFQGSFAARTVASQIGAFFGNSPPGAPPPRKESGGRESLLGGSTYGAAKEKEQTASNPFGINPNTKG